MIPELSIKQIRNSYYLMFNTSDLITMIMSNHLEFDQYNVDISSLILDLYTDGLVLDIGANMGTYTIPLATKHTNFNFHCFEPQKIINYQLTANIILNRLDNILSHRIALSDAVGNIEITVPDYNIEQNIGAFSIDEFVRNNYYECSSTGKSEVMELRRLDDYNFENVQLMKVDVEGHELEVFKGGLKTVINNNYPTILLECWNTKPWYQEKAELTKNFLKDLGYVLYGHHSDLLAQHPNRVSLEKDIIDNSPFSILDTPLP